MYTVEDAFEKLNQLGITDNIEVVRRWLRSGQLKGIPPKKRRDGWRITNEDLDAFIIERAPGLQSVLNTTKVVNDEVKRNKTKVANKEFEQLQEELKNLQEQNEQLLDRALRLEAQNQKKNEKGNSNQMSRKLVEELWNITLDNWRYDLNGPLPDTEILQSAKDSLFQSLFPSGDTAKIETKTQYICPFTNKRFGSFDKLIKAAIPKLISSAQGNQKQKKQLQELRDREEEKKQNLYWDQF